MADAEHFADQEVSKINKISDDLEDVASNESDDEELMEIEDEINVEDSVEGDEPLVQEDTTVEDSDLNWEDLEVVDEVGNDTTRDEELGECELQNISEDEDDSLERLTNVSPEKRISHETPLSVVIGDSSKDELVPKENVGANNSVTETSIDSATENLPSDDQQRNEDAVVDDLENLTPVSTENKCIADSTVVELDVQFSSVRRDDIQNITSIESDEDVDDVLDIAVREDLELNESEPPVAEIVKTDGSPPVMSTNNSDADTAAVATVVDSFVENDDAESDEVLIVDEVPPKPLSLSSDLSSGNAKRSEPFPSVALYIDSLAQLSFDWKKYTCFYCVPCQVFVTTTSLFEDHIGSVAHKENNFRWRTANDLTSSEIINRVSKHQADIEKCNDFIPGVDFVMEICDDSYKPRHWYCRLCNCVINSVDLLLVHLKMFSHIDNFVEKRFPNVFWSLKPNENDKTSCGIRVCTEAEEKQVIAFAKQKVKGVSAKLKMFHGASLTEMNDEDVQAEEDLLASQIHQFFNDGKDYKVKIDFFSSNTSVANAEYKQMNLSKKNSVIGLQYLLEIWPPSCRVSPVWYCMLCDSLVSNWSQHCGVVQHIAAYLKKHYEKSAFNCSVLEANDEEHLRTIFSITMTKVLQLEGHGSRVNNVIQIKRMEDFESFVAINAIIAKNLVDQRKIKVGDPPRAKRPSISQDSKSKKQTTSVDRKSSPKQTNSSARKLSNQQTSKSPTKASGNSRNVNSLRQTTSSNSPKTSQKLAVDSSKVNGKASSNSNSKTKPATPKSTKSAVASPKVQPATKVETPKASSTQKSAVDQKSSAQKKISTPVSGKANITVSKTVATLTPKSTAKSDSSKSTAGTSASQTQAKPNVSKQISSSSAEQSKNANNQSTAATVAAKKISNAASKSRETDKTVSRVSTRTSPKRRKSRSVSRSPKKRRSEDDKSPRRRKVEIQRRRPSPPVRRYSPPQRRRFSPLTPKPVFDAAYRRIVSPSPIRHRRSPSPRYEQITPRIRIPIIIRSPPRSSPTPPLLLHHKVSRRHARSRSPMDDVSVDVYRNRTHREEHYRRPTPELIIDYQHQQQQQKFDLANDVVNAVLQSASSRQQVAPPSSSIVEQPVVFLSNDNLAKFTDLLRLVGFDIGRRITLDDLDGLRERFGSTMFDQFLNMVLTQPLGVIQQQHQPSTTGVSDLLSLNMLVGQQQRQQQQQTGRESNNQRRAVTASGNFYAGNTSANKKRNANRTPTKQASTPGNVGRQYSIQQRVGGVTSQPQQKQQHASSRIVEYFDGQNSTTSLNAPSNMGSLNLSVPPPPIPLQQTSQQQQQQSLMGFLNAANLFGNSSASSLPSNMTQQQQQSLFGQSLFDAGASNFWPSVNTQGGGGW